MDDYRTDLVKLMGFTANEIAPKVREILDELVREHEQSTEGLPSELRSKHKQQKDNTCTKV